jgi:hypothetical protein
MTLWPFTVARQKLRVGGALRGVQNKNAPSIARIRISEKPGGARSAQVPEPAKHFLDGPGSGGLEVRIAAFLKPVEVKLAAQRQEARRHGPHHHAEQTARKMNFTLQYKQIGSKLVLGIWDGERNFTPFDPPQTMDVSKSLPLNLPHSVLTLSETTSRTYIDSNGNTVKETFDPTSGTQKIQLTEPKSR